MSAPAHTIGSFTEGKWRDDTPSGLLASVDPAHGETVA